MDLHKYRQKYPEAMALVENNPQLADKTAKTSLPLWKNKAQLCYSISNPTSFLPNEAVSVAILACAKDSKVPESAEQTPHIHSVCLG